MRHPSAADAVRRFVAAAIEAAGKQRNVLALLEEEGIRSDKGEPYSERAISAWKTGDTRRVPADALFALARRTGVSLDRYAMADGRSLEERLFEIHQILTVHGHAIDDLREFRGEGPMEFPSIGDRP